MTNDQPHADSAHSNNVPQPQRPTPVAHMPRPLTFFLSAKERATVLRALRSFDSDRARALMKSLGITPNTPSNEGGP